MSSHSIGVTELDQLYKSTKQAEDERVRTLLFEMIPPFKMDLVTEEGIPDETAAATDGKTTGIEETDGIPPERRTGVRHKPSDRAIVPGGGR